MRLMKRLVLAGLALPFAGAAHAQQALDLPQIDVTKVVAEIGPGWVKKQTGEEGVTFVCESDACGGRGVVGVGQAKPSPDYVKLVVAEPDKALQSFKYGTEESLKATGCAFKSFDVRRLSDHRVQYEGLGFCPEGATAAMTTIFDSQRLGMMSVQILTKSEAGAVKLRDDSVEKIVAALDAPAADAQPAAR
ncbi:hypothetical protein [Chenggangzhangella methanolivorans]|uniref:Invasion associated locus B family protein n=1 Tax=Chenggangzhangella methanolivorans TaxID=1437009 RepID=A0A9E6R741_9HYPH|nr:hypothetical protein [Chenggangzhangella methanolivorans]QZN99049.1 hypothetical protein K6K41_19610 [Chenggangzhangella methanolivorans]